MNLPLPQLKHNWSSCSSFQTLLVLMAKQDLPPQELCWPWRCYSIRQAPGERCWWECLSWGLGGCSWWPPLSRDGPWDHQGGRCVAKTTSCAFRGFCTITQYPRAVAIPEWDTVGEALPDPKDWISGIAMPMEKALWGGRRGRRSYYIFYIQLLPYGQVMCALNLRSVNDSVLYRTVTFDLHI